MTLLLQSDYTVVSALKYMMTFCKQPFVDISIPFYLQIRQKTDVFVYGLLGWASCWATTGCLHIFLIGLPLLSLPNANLPESNWEQ